MPEVLNVCLDGLLWVKESFFNSRVHILLSRNISMSKFNLFTSPSKVTMF